MCGFAGVVTWDEKYRVTRDTLEKMSRAIAHRGPDGEGYHLTRENEPITPDTPQIGLAFRRLAILDPDPRSNQPFHIGPLTLVFNGEIYNFRGLKSEISKLRPDYRWRTTGDTEVLLMAYEVWREKCVEKLNGMFAFAVWDEAKKELFLARDRMGQKPLYLARGDIADDKNSRKFIAFASEPAALRAVECRSSAHLRFEAIAQYLCWGYMPPIPQPFESFAPSWRLLAARKGLAESSFFAHMIRGPREKEWSGLNDDARVSLTRRMVQQAVERQLVSDVPIGCFLSGGADSSVIALCMQRATPTGQRLLTFSMGFDDHRYDETRYAVEVARRLGTEHHCFILRPNAVDDLYKLATVFGEPFADSSALPTYYLAQQTRTHVKVALSGDGGDEMFGGYDRYRALQFTERLHRLPQPFQSMVLSKAVQRAIAVVPGKHPKSRFVRAKRLMASAGQSVIDRYASYVRVFDEKLIEELLEREIDMRARKHFSLVQARFWTYLRTRGPVPAALATDRETYLPNDLLVKVDRCSMFHALEVRSPFMDHELVRFASTFTEMELLGGGPKRMLREAFAKDLPDFVFKRKKMGFAVPIGEWFRGELRPMLRDNLFAANAFGRTHFNMKVVERLVEEHETQRVDHSQRLYALLMLELWWQQQVK